MMHPDAIEEMNWNPLTELQAGFQLSKLEMADEPDDRREIQDLVDAGRFVVMIDAVRYCPRTDALMGTKPILVSDHADRQSAEAAANALGDQHEDTIRVLPMERPPEPDRSTETNGDIPF